ncbi:MAG: hypothetical protein N2044_11490, partial [Cyclobacteriaceae bacterium]|nr:hypothetical protein [Cyclobacteriaceae bacterium]
MNFKKYILGTVLMGGVVMMACRDESLYPLPYDDRTSAHYLRIYRSTTNVFEFNDLANSAVEFVFESVDEQKGALLSEVEFYATHRNGATGAITDEVLVTTIPASAMNFAFVPEPTYSEYLRSAPVRITHAQIQAALATLTTDPDGTSCSNIYPDVCPAVAYPGALAANDQVILRWKTRLTDGREYTVANVQTVISPSLGNPEEANMTPNITSGQFYNAPYTFTVTVRRTTNPYVANAYTGNYRMTQMAVWSPNHNLELHQTIPTRLVRPFIFGSSDTDSTQTVTLSLITGGLPTERLVENVRYKGQTISFRINLEGGPNPGLSAAALATLTDPFSNISPASGMGMTGATNAVLGTVFVPLVNTGVDCTSEREFYMVTPLAGTFGGTTALRFGLPRRAYPRREFYRIDQSGLVAGQVFTIAVDDDADEYGRRNG